MHEFLIMQNIFTTLEAVVAENQLQRVDRIKLKIGQLRQIVPEFLTFAFQQCVKNTVMANAELVIEAVPITIRCRKCQQQTQVKDNAYICPQCEATQVEVITGKEIILESVDGEK